MKLNAKLVIIMLTLLVLAMLTLFLLNQYAQEGLVREIQESSQEISKAVQMSIEDLTSETETSRLTEYLNHARDKGVNEINIINNEGEIIDSTDPDKIGKKRDIKKIEKGVRVVQRPVGGAILSQRLYEVVVPVIVGDEHLGYVHINMLLDKIRDIQHANFIRRLFATGMVFVVGIAFTIYLARRYTEPIQRLIDVFKRVSAGDLSVSLPEDGSKDEIGDLAAGFNNMVEKLREREALEKRLYEAEHLSRVGQLASGIAHEIRNPLNYISLAIDHLKAEILPRCGERGAELAELTDKIKEEVRRVNYMVLNFMNYGRPLKLRRSLASYSDILAKVLPVLHDRLVEQRTTVEQQIPPDLPPLWVDQELLRNCILNLISNAAQAMDNGGVITLGAALDEERNQVRLTFADQGSGIREEDLAKIFQPYFTTKDVGIGLGLAITERIIKEHGGEIAVESVLGVGTTFTMLLPLKTEETTT